MDTFTLDRIGASGAVLIEGQVGHLMQLPLARVRDLYRSAGVLMFRGFDVDCDTMKAFADQFSLRFNRDRLRPPVPGSNGFVQMVTEGMGYVEPHSEQANSPFRPDAIWFCCETPSSDGGETLYWDGVRIWERLSPALKALFQEKRLRFFQRYARDKWELFLGPGAGLDQVREALDGRPGVSYFIAPDQALYLEYVCSAVVPTRYGEKLAFANSLLSERQNTLGALFSFHDGTPVPEAAIDEIKGVMSEVEEQIAWRPGDLAMIDNSRFVHGRNAYLDPRRKIYSALSFLNF